MAVLYSEERMRGFNQEGGVYQKIASGRNVGDLVWMVKTMSWILRISLRSKEPLGGHPLGRLATLLNK